MSEAARDVAAQVDPGLDTDDHVLGKYVGAALSDPRSFVIAEADPVTRAVKSALFA